MTDYEDRIEEMTFEECMSALEGLVNELEQGGIGLDRSVEIYEQAVVLRNRCKSILDESERRIQKLIENSGGTDKVDFDID